MNSISEHPRNRCSKWLLMVAWSAALISCVAPGRLLAQEPMQRFPETARGQVTLMNQMQPPYSRWGLRNMAIQPAVLVPRAGPVYEISRGSDLDLDERVFEFDGEKISVLSALEAENTDGFIVIKNGNVVYERYFGSFSEHSHHFWGGSTGSLVAMAAAILIDRGDLKADGPVPDHIPELSGGAFSGLSIQQVLNMVSAIDFTETPSDLIPGSNQFEYFRRAGFIPAFDLMALDPKTAKTPRGILELLKGLQSDPALDPGQIFEFQSPNVDVIGWIVSRAGEMALNNFLATQIWSKIGAEHDAFFTTDPAFTPLAANGFNTTLRDFARFGLAVLNDGSLGGNQVFPKDLVHSIPDVTEEDIRRARRSMFRAEGSPSYDPELLAFHNFWWVHDRDKGIFSARGEFGQILYIDRSTSTVIASFSSAPEASNGQRPEFHTKMAALKFISSLTAPE